MYSLSELFGNYPRVKILEALADNSGEEISIPYIQRVTGVAKSTIYEHIGKLEGEGLVNFTDTVRHRSKDTRLYQLNPDDDRAKMVTMIEDFLVSGLMTKLLKESGEKTIFEEIEESLLQSEISPKKPSLMGTATEGWVLSTWGENTEEAAVPGRALPFTSPPLPPLTAGGLS